MPINKYKQFALLITLALCAGIFIYARPVAAYASDGDTQQMLIVDSVWLEGDILHIEVRDASNDANKALELNLPDYAGYGDEYVAICAVDKDGNRSNTIQFKNPYYDESFVPAETDASASGEQSETDASQRQGTQDISEDGAIPDGSKPFTPDGSGSVLDNVNEHDGKEFFSIKTDDGNVFYLIVDRQRQTENVYLLNAVTEQDLLALAKPQDNAGGGAIPSLQTARTSDSDSDSESVSVPKPEPPPVKQNKNGVDTGTLLFILFMALAVGGAGYYFKIVKPKSGAKDSEEDYDETDDEDIYGESDGGEEGDAE